MADFRPADHAMGLELQLDELMEQRERARVQGRSADAARLEGEISALQAELALTAELAVTEGPPEDPGPELQYAEELNREDGRK
jgi:hypothetical protein